MTHSCPTRRTAGLFDGQDILESGAARPYARHDGWIGRLFPLLPGGRAVAVAPTLPLVLQGSPDVVSYMPSGDEDPQGDLLARVELLYTADARPNALSAETIDIQRLARAAAPGGRPPAQPPTH